MIKPETVHENEMSKILWNLEKQMHHLILAKRSDLGLINKDKRICHQVNFGVPEDHRVKIKKNEKIKK